ncbi:MAG: YfhO family protein [Bacteroidota bacterium]
MKDQLMKKFLPWVAAIIIFALVSVIYFSPVLEGKKLQQQDIRNFQGMSKEISDFRNQNHQEPLWTNSMFGGMPAFQISTLYNGNLTRYFDNMLQLGLPQPANYLFLSALGFFILLMVLGVNPWLAVAGALGYSFSSYFFIILEAGHNSKAHAMAYMAPVLAGLILTYKGKLLPGGVLTALFLSLEIGANHLQITYYLMLAVMIFFIAELYSAIIQKKMGDFAKASAVALVAGIIALGPNLGNLWNTYEYSKYTTRGPSELTANKGNKTSGLDKDYATAWSYGVGESMTILIPDFKGGGSYGELSKNSDTYKALMSNGIPNADQAIKQMPTYWGDQPFTSGPVYIGSIFIFLFVLGMFFVKGPMKWWLFAASLLSIMLAWGRNFPGFTDFFLDYFPGYNKFRAVSMTLVIAELCIPLLGIVALQQISEHGIDRKKAFNAVKYALGITAGLCLLFALFGGSFFSFAASGDEQMRQSGYPDWLMTAIISDRKSLMQSDAFRSFVFIILAGALVWALLFEKLKKNWVFAGMALLLLVDLWMVDRRYLKNSDFAAKHQVENPFSPSAADETILQDKDLDYRVINLAANTFNDASTSYYHKSIGGYHGAKLKRYQELIENQISKNNMEVLNMMNTRYFIMKDKDGKENVQRNPQACGNAWFVSQYKMVANADSEMVALDKFNPRATAVVDKRFEDQLLKYKAGSFDSTATIKLDSYQPNHLVYSYTAKTDQLAVFSEIYYDKGWNAYIDGKVYPYFRTNYVLRGMVLPAGSKKLEFKFEPNSYYVGEKVSYAGSFLLIILVLGLVLVEGKKAIAAK